MSTISPVNKIRVKGVYYDLIRQVEDIDSSTLLTMNDDSSLMKVYVDANEDNVYVASHSDVIKIAGEDKTLTQYAKTVDDYIEDFAETVFDKKVITSLVKGFIKQNGGLETNNDKRVSTGYLDATETPLLVKIQGDYCIRTANKYNSSETHLEQLLNIVDYQTYKFEKGYKYRITLCKKSDPTSNITKEDLAGKVISYTMPNTSNTVKLENLANEIDAINNLDEGTSGEGESVPISLVPGVIDGADTFVDSYTKRVTTNVIDATENAIILRVGGPYSIRNGNQYTSAGVFIRQYLKADLLSEMLLPKGYKYRMSICATSNLSQDITPEQVEPYVSAYTSNAKREIVVKVNDTEEKVLKLEGNVFREKYLVADFFGSVYKAENYSNFNSSNISNGRYVVSAGWTNTLKTSKVVSFHDFTYEFDIETSSNTEQIVVATEVTEAVAMSNYGSCAYIDMSASKMYLLKPALFTTGQPSASNKIREMTLTNITSQCHRYVVSFGKKNRNLFVRFSNYNTGETVELTCIDDTNTSLAGSGYDKIRVGSMSGNISVNSIIGATKTDVDILFVGDSITDGRNILLADSWAYKLGEYLTDNYLIASRAGGQIQQVIDLLNAYGKTINPKVVVVSVGVNGGNTTDKFLELFNIIKNLGAIPVINTIYNVGSTFGNITEQEWNTMNSYILSLPCKHIRFDIASSADKNVPIFKSLDVNYTLTDHVHPDAGGSELLYQRAVLDLNLRDDDESKNVNIKGLNDLQGAGKIVDLTIPEWIVGKLDSSGANTASDYHLRSNWILRNGTIELYAGDELYIESVFIYNGTTMVSTVVYGKSLDRCRYTIGSGYRARVVVKRKDGAAMTTVMGSLLSANVVQQGSRIFNVEEKAEDVDVRLADVESKFAGGEAGEETTIPLISGGVWMNNSSTGQSVENEGYSYSNPYPVRSGDTIKVTVSVGDGAYGVWGSLTNVFNVSNGQALVDKNSTKYNEVITIPQGVNYIFISSRNENFTTPFSPSASYTPRGASWLENKIEEVVRNSAATNPFKGLKLVTLGDSITQGQVMSGTAPSKPFPVLVAEELGMELVNYGISGSTIGICTNYGGTFASLADFNAATKDTSKYYVVITGNQTYTDYYHNGSSWIALGEGHKPMRTPLVDRYNLMAADADIILVAGGTNDFQYNWEPIGEVSDTVKTTFRGALNNLCEGLITKYPQKCIVFMTPIKRCQTLPAGDPDISDHAGGEYGTIDSQNTFGKTLKEYGDIIKEMCARYSIPVIDMYSECGLNPQLSAQSSLFDSYKTHPYQAGHNMMARLIVAKLMSIFGMNVGV